VNRFAAMAKVFPVIPLPAAEARFQPIWVEDVARAFAHALDDGGTAGKSFNLCGPKAYALREIVELAARLSGHPRPVVPVPDGIARLEAAVLEHLPGPLLTRDNLRSMEVPNVCDAPFPERFGFAPSSLESVLPQYLADASPRGRYDHYRLKAGR
jgi:NADH dehydrogenase